MVLQRREDHKKSGPSSHHAHFLSFKSFKQAGTFRLNSSSGRSCFNATFVRSVDASRNSPAVLGVACARVEVGLSTQAVRRLGKCLIAIYRLFFPACVRVVKDLVAGVVTLRPQVVRVPWH